MAGAVGRASTASSPRTADEAMSNRSTAPARREKLNSIPFRSTATASAVYGVRVSPPDPPGST